MISISRIQASGDIGIDIDGEALFTFERGRIDDDGSGFGSVLDVDGRKGRTVRHIPV